MPKKLSKRKSPHVPAQFLGYALQPTRLLDLALDAPPGSVLSLEVFEDVGVESATGEHLASQTKSALVKNPISDHALDLWKTFSNWLTAVEEGHLPLQNTIFEIYLAKKHHGPITESFHSAKNQEEAQAALRAARHLLWGAPPKYRKPKALQGPIKEFTDHFLDPKNTYAAGIVERFQLCVAVKDPLHDLRPRVASKWLRPESVDIVIQHAHGWIKESLESLLLLRKPAVLSVDAFNAEMTAFLPRCDFRQILHSMAGRANATTDEIAAEQVRLYVQQLELIEYSDEDVIEAINHFLRASAERAAWGEAGIVHELSFDEYESALIEYWKNTKRAQRITFKSLSQVEHGQLLLSECYKCQQKLQGLEVPSFFTPGSFHALAEDTVLGWHPEYAKLLNTGGANDSSQ